MKKSLLFSTVIVAATTAFAAAPTMQKADKSAFEVGPKAPTMAQKAMTRAMDSFDFTYADAPYNGLSLNGMKAGDKVYMLFEMAQTDVKTFAGSKVTDFTVCSPTGQNGAANTITEGTFFYSTDPALASLDYTQDFSMSTEPFVYNKVSVETPYTITGDEEALFFGYIIDWKPNMYYVIVDGTENHANTAIIGVPDDPSKLPAEYMPLGEAYGALCMGVTLERENLPKFVSFTNFPETICLKQGEALSLPVTLSATSGAPIESITLEYTLGGKPNEMTFSSSTPLPAGAGRLLNVSIEFPAQKEKFNETVEFKLTKINGEENICDGNTVSADVVVVSEVPVHQALYEEYTGTWCGYCPRGFAALEYMGKNHPDFVTASYHYGQGTSRDPMQVLNFYPSSVSSFPSAVLDRSAVYDPYYGSNTSDCIVPIVGDIQAINAMPTVWMVKVSHEWASADEIVAHAEFANMAGFNDKDFKIGYILIADGLSGTSALWRQSNYYASNAQSAQNAPELNQFCRGGIYGKSYVTDLVFNDVVVSAEGVMGIEGSVPTSLASEEVATHSLTFDLSNISSSLIPDKKKLRVVAMVLDKNGKVLNCAKDEVNDEFMPSAVEGIERADAPVEFYNLNGMKVAEPTEGIYIRRQGSKAEKVIIR